MKEHQTPNKAFACSAMNRNGRSKGFPSKKPVKIANRSLNAEFTSVSEDSVDLSPISEILDVNGDEHDTTYLLEESSSVILVPSDLTPKKITDKAEFNSANCISGDELLSSKFNSVEAEIAVKFIRNVRTKMFNSVNAAPRRRNKFMDEIIEYVIQHSENNTLPVKRAHSSRMLSMKNRVLLLCTFIWVIGVSIVLFLTLDARSPYRGPTPT